MPDVIPSRDVAVPFSSVLAGLSYALDLTEGQRPGHAVRSCLIGMRVARTLALPPAEREALYHALLMKDLGCSSNAARFAALFGGHDHDIKVDIKTIDWTRALESFRFVARNAAPGHFWMRRVWRMLAVFARGEEGAREVVRTRCERGADIAALLGLPDAVSQAIRALDEHWNGKGQPYGLGGNDIPLLARVMNLAQTVEVFASSRGVSAAFDVVAARRGTWFDPLLVDALFATPEHDPFWSSLGRDDLAALERLRPAERLLAAGDAQLDVVAQAFARVIDAKSPWTFRHSEGVATLATRMADELDYTPAARRELHRAALLHDIGKLGVSNLILDKPGRLTDGELAVMRLHPSHTASILRRVSCFASFADMAAAHHERLDGHGYHRGLSGERVPGPSRILAVADICDALRASRPYRQGLPDDRVLEILRRDAGTGLDAECVAALETVLRDEQAPTEACPPAARLVHDLAEDYAQAA